MTNEEVEKIIKSNMNLQMNLAGIRADFEEKLQRIWIGLTDEEVFAVSNTMPYADRFEFAVAIEDKLRSKNHEI